MWCEHTASRTAKLYVWRVGYGKTAELWPLSVTGSDYNTVPRFMDSLCITVQPPVLLWFQSLFYNYSFSYIYRVIQKEKSVFWRRTYREPNLSFLIWVAAVYTGWSRWKVQYFGSTIYIYICWSQWPRGLRRRSAVARLMRSWVRIPPGAWMYVCCECCVLSGRGLCDGLIARPEESYRLWCVVVCDLEKPEEWGCHSPRLGCKRHKNIYIYIYIWGLDKAATVVILLRFVWPMNWGFFTSKG